VEKLRRYLSRRGVVIPVATLAAVISANSVQAAPVTVAKTAMAAALAQGATASGSTATLVKGALKLMAWTKTKTTIAAAAVVLFTAGVAAVGVKFLRPDTVNLSGLRATVLAGFNWEDVARKGQLAGGKIMKMDGKTVLRIIGATNGVALPLLKIEKPPITAAHFAVIGEIKYENVGGGHVNMWGFFPPLRTGLPERQFYSYTGDIGPGPAARIYDSSDWRPFWLPMDRAGNSDPQSLVLPKDIMQPPTRLEVGIFLGSSGVVYLRGLKLVQWEFQSSAMGNLPAL
jgi:hypothetical protein